MKTVCRSFQLYNMNEGICYNADLTSICWKDSGHKKCEFAQDIEVKDACLKRPTQIDGASARSTPMQKMQITIDIENVL